MNGLFYQEFHRSERENIMDNILKVIKNMKNLNELYGVESMHYPYYHTTFRVETLSEFMDIIAGFGKTLRNDIIYKMFYRGMSNESWSPIPSLARNRKFELNEKELIHEFKYRCPENFFNLNTNFELLADMQHYGLPTRLLDFTENPLIALYFACKDLKRNNGRVLCLCSFECPDLKQYAKILCDIACDGDINEEIDLYTQKYNISSVSFINEMCLDNSYVLIKPPYWNERQKRQRSVFLVFNNLLRDVYGQAIYYDYNFDIKKNVRSSIEKHEDLIKIYQNSPWEPNRDFTEKNPMKKPLSFIVNKESWELMKGCYGKNNEHIMGENCTNRFRLVQQLETLNEDELEKSFCSIIIPANCKKNILFELSLIGINESFVYPEKEYIANDIKNNIK